jgi:hypothetical protein
MSANITKTPNMTRPISTSLSARNRLILCIPSHLA